MESKLHQKGCPHFLFIRFLNSPRATHPRSLILCMLKQISLLFIFAKHRRKTSAHALALQLAENLNPVNSKKTGTLPSHKRAGELEILVSGMITFSHSIGEKMKHRYQFFTRFGRQFQSLKR